MITEYKDICIICGKPSECVHHLIFGMAKRDLADQDGLTMPMCNSCHNMGRYRLHDNPMAESLSKMLGQAIWEGNNNHDRERFIKRYGKSWL